MVGLINSCCFLFKILWGVGNLWALTLVFLCFHFILCCLLPVTELVAKAMILYNKLWHNDFSFTCDFRLLLQCEFFAVLGSYAALIGSWVPTFWDSISVSSSRSSSQLHDPEDETGRLSWRFINYKSTFV